MKILWKHLAPVVVAVALALILAPEGLPQHAWYFFAILVAVIVRLMFEPLPEGAIFGIIFFVVFTVISVAWVLARGRR